MFSSTDAVPPPVRLAAALLLLSGSALSASFDLDWTPPTHNTDGSQLTDLEAYGIYWDCGAGESSDLIFAPATAYTVEGLPDDGTCEFTVTALNTAGTESGRSGVLVHQFVGGVPDAPTVGPNITWSESMTVDVFIAVQTTALRAPADTFKTWNTIHDFTEEVQIADLLDSGGAATGWSFELVDGFALEEGTNGVNSAGSGDAAWVDEAIISVDNHDIANGDGTVIYEIAGLDDDALYNIEIYGSRDGSGTRNLEVSTDNFVSSSETINCLGNNSETAKLLDVSPTTGAIRIYWRSTTAGSFGYVNAIWIQEEAVVGGGLSIPIAMSHYQGLH